MAGDFDINVNWGQFVLDTLVAGIRHFRLGKGSWFTAWTDDLMKKRVHAELHDYGDFGLADVQEDEREEDAHEDPVEDEVQMNAIIPYETTSSNTFISATSTCYCPSITIRGTTVNQIFSSSSVAKQVLAYALDDTRDESQILCSMHNFFLTRFDLKCLGPDKLVEKKVVTMHCRILNGMDKENRKHFLSPNFVSDVEKKRGSLSPKYICDNLWKYFKNTRLCTYEQVNVLSTVIGIQERRPSVDMTEFEFVVPEVVQQLNPTDCGIFVMKFMQLWSNGGISRAIANDKVIKYREKLLTQLIMSPENEVRENVYQAMDQ
ncbi:hypothetical protein CK203_054938 [Vitis vinifera]|uniref:Ubiquitin-like protease family profile domain-containing protein n=1 Tax=Vitis vinifera TaxID=29760 RepID=A0A438GJ49_VITVI|nr:hypothetical protein CK203_054938 [Vitis vinifera]